MSSRTTFDAPGSRPRTIGPPVEPGLVRTMTPRPEDRDDLTELRFLDEEGNIVDDRAPTLSPDEIKTVHRAMVLTRVFDERMLMMQRQGAMGTFAPGIGQEATQIGQVYPLGQVDWFSPSYRSFGAQLWRGWTIDGLMLLWDGYFEGFEIPEGVNDMPFSIVIGSHVPVAAGIAMGIRLRGDDGVVMVNYGDGASSQGAISEAMNFASVYKAPCVFMCENNGWAISTPTDQQAGVESLAKRGPAFGMPAMRVDGNDIFAMIHASQRAVEHARNGNGPFLIEAVTYRMGLHTTADNPKVYRDDSDVEAWEARCPILRLERYMKRMGLLDDAGAQAVRDDCDRQVKEGRDRFRDRAKAAPEEIFDYMFKDMSPQLRAQQIEYMQRLGREGKA